MKINIGSLIIIVFASFSFGCNKNTSTEKILIQNKWMLVDCISDIPIDISNSGKPSTNLYSQNQPCSNDDIYSFKEGNVFIIDDNRISCGEQKISEGSWQILPNDSLSTTINPGQTFLNGKFTLVNDEKFIIKANMPFLPNGVNVTYTFHAINLE